MCVLGGISFLLRLVFLLSRAKRGYEGDFPPARQARSFFNSSSHRRRGTEAFKRCRSGGVFRIDKTQPEKPTYPQK
ncbi:MAG: hypothetical protein IIT71_05315 [Acetobacter sp.]|nr:hypothetical protein [Acetobacter sp.]